jgi:hypothetical protein
MSAIRPSRYYVAKIYVKRILRWRRNSFPFLSVDSFADFCDINATPPRFRGKLPNKYAIANAKTIFCDSDKLQEFLNKHHKSITAKVIVSGNTDYEFHSELINVPSSVRRFYLQNSFISAHPLYRTIPIGIENFRYGLNGHPRLMQKKITFKDRQKSALVGPFSKTHFERSVLEKNITESVFIRVVNQRCSPRSLSKLFQKYQFVAAVRGNGVDTHRLWESLYRGCVPLVKLDSWSQFLVEHKLPIEFIRNWNTEEIEKCVSESLFTDFSPERIPALWMPYWIDFILDDLKD